jgi:hypothetical protein
MFSTKLWNTSVNWHFYVLLIYGLFCLSPLTLAAVAVSSNGSQEIMVGTPSADIGFEVIDELGHPDTGATIKFSLVDPSGKLITNGLSTSLGSPNSSGQVFTRLNATGVIGIYTITATVLTDATQFASTYVIVTAGAPASLTVVSGAKQNLVAGEMSAPITFRLTDMFGNVLPGHLVNFSIKTSATGIAGGSLIPNQATTDTIGQASTSLETAEQEGESEYTVIASIDSNNQIVTSTTVTVTASPPQLPSLGFGSILSTSGVTEDTDATFSGGIAINDSDFQPEAVLTLEDKVAVAGMIQADSTHLGKTADLLVVANYKPNLPVNTSEERYYMLDDVGHYQLWDGNMASLTSFKQNVPLSKDLVVKMYDGKFVVDGQLKIYFGYRLEDGVVVFNGNQTINVLIKK